MLIRIACKLNTLSIKYLKGNNCFEHSFNNSKDSVTIYDGGNKTSPKIGVFCGNSLPPTGSMMSSTRKLLIHFQTDLYGQFEGFQIEYDIISKFFFIVIILKTSVSIDLILQLRL